MPYIVTHGPYSDKGPVAIDSGKPRPFTLEQALAHACGLLAEGKPAVAIQDGNGRSISGADLAACCQGSKTLTADLQAN